MHVLLAPAQVWRSKDRSRRGILSESGFPSWCFLGHIYSEAHHYVSLRNSCVTQISSSSLFSLGTGPFPNDSGFELSNPVSAPSVSSLPFAASIICSGTAISTSLEPKHCPFVRSLSFASGPNHHWQRASAQPHDSVQLFASFRPWHGLLPLPQARTPCPLYTSAIRPSSPAPYRNHSPRR